MMTPNDTNPVRVVFFGTPHFAAVQLTALLEMRGIRVVGVVTQPDRPSGRGQKLTPSPVKQLTQQHELPILQPKSLRKESESVIDFCNCTGPWDIGVVAAYGLIIPQPILDLPRSGCINVHGSLLPRWRGAAPIQRAIMAGDASSGVCLMKMEAGLDTGPVFISASTEIDPAETSASLGTKLASLGAELLKEYLVKIYSAELMPQPQPEQGVTYAEKILKEEGQINWASNADEIERLIRGLNPSPGAFMMLGGERMKIWAARGIANDATDANITPGQIEIVEGRLLIGCGSHTVIEITELQPAGRKRLSSSEYLRGVDCNAMPRHVD